MRVGNQVIERQRHPASGAGMFAMHAWFFNNDTCVLTDDWKDSNMQDPKVAETLQFLADLNDRLGGGPLHERRRALVQRHAHEVGRVRIAYLELDRRV